MKAYVIGIDVGGTSVKLGILKTDGCLLEKWEITTRRDDNGIHILPDAENMTAVQIFNQGRAGDEASDALVNELSDMLGRAIAQLTCVTNPEMVVIGGGVSRAGEYLLGKIRKAFAKYAFHACRDTKFGLAVLGNDAGIYGAARLAMTD